MAAQVYSTRFIGFEGSGGATQSYTVPSGYRAVVACVVAQIGAGASSSVYLGIASPLVILVNNNGSGTTPTFFYWSGRLVVNEGEELFSELSGPNGSTIAASGYLLTV